MIATIFGKKGSGKTTLSKQYMYSMGGRVVFISPVETVKGCDAELWGYDEIDIMVPGMRKGNIFVLKRADIEAFDMVALNAMIYGDYTLVIDEIERYKTSPQLKDLAHYSRHCKINLVANTRRYADVPRLLTSQSDELCVFATHEPRDIEYIRHFTDFTPEQLKALPQFTYLKFPTREALKTSVFS